MERLPIRMISSTNDQTGRRFGGRKWGRHCRLPGLRQAGLPAPRLLVSRFVVWRDCVLFCLLGSTFWAELAGAAFASRPREQLQLSINDLLAVAVEPGDVAV